MAAPSEASAHALLAAAEAARRAGVEVADLDDVAELHQVAELFIEIWQTSVQQAPCTPQLLRALAHSGNYVAGARLEGRIVGGAVAFLQRDRDGLALHSHITGVSAAAQGRSVGFALKQHQRAWALARGIPRVNWTFDPLVRRNAWFNLVKLGAEGVEYLPDFYGRMADGINAGDETDRCLVSWRLESDRAVAAAEGRAATPSLEALRAAGATVVLAEGRDGRPAESEPADRASTLLAWVPQDVVALRASDPALALQWRRALRTTMGSAMRRGFVAAGMTRSGWYLLERSRREVT
ncbi:MAG TPA: GNAT family N-acetyltransferase [Actinomycetes bacterium]|jgi:predicted GNAT superfamily acetyltransferase|nr:GNAT family N-acetyltransferase [Actinomycetes bacterium]